MWKNKSQRPKWQANWCVSPFLVDWEYSPYSPLLDTKDVLFAG